MFLLSYYLLSNLYEKKTDFCNRNRLFLPPGLQYIVEAQELGHRMLRRFRLDAVVTRLPAAPAHG